MRLPDPQDRPLLRPQELVGLHPDLRRSSVYEAIKRGEIPAIRLGARLYVPTAALMRLLALSEYEIRGDYQVAGDRADTERDGSLDSGGINAHG